MILHQRIKLATQPGATVAGLPNPTICEGRVIYQNQYFFTVRTRAGWCESFLHVDLAANRVREIRGKVEAVVVG